MPHATVRIYPGPGEDAKKKLAEDIRTALLICTGAPAAAVSVRIAEVSPECWKECVYDMEIAAAGNDLYVAPGYEM